MKNKVLACVAAGLIAAPTQAAVVVTIKQMGSDVKVEGSGTLNIGSLGSAGDIDLSAGITAGNLSSDYPAYVAVGSTASQLLTQYSIPGSPFTLGTGNFRLASVGSGDKFAIYSPRSGTLVYLAVPKGYVSGSSLSGESFFYNTTLAGLGLTTGTFVWTWGSDASADSFTLKIGETTTAPPVPLPAAAWLLLSGLAGLGVVGRRKRSEASA